MSERVLESSPSLLPLFARAGAALIPGASRLPFVGGAAREIPDLALTLSPVYADRERLAAYSHVCGFSLSDVLPPTYIHILAFPLHLSIMTDPSFPFPAIGLVHIGNEITHHRPVKASETLSVRSWATELEPHPRGKQFSLRTEARVGEEVVWEEVGTILKRGPSGSGSGSGSSTKSQSESKSESDPPTTATNDPPTTATNDLPTTATNDLPTTSTWKLRGDLGRRYASVSGDMNPIHMHWLSAKLLGFPSAIAHGMWTKARCLAALEGRLPETFTVEASFKRPIVLPATVAFGEAPLASGAGRAGIRFGVKDERKGTPHLDGAVKFG
jgi:acyl dehydratase